MRTTKFYMAASMLALVCCLSCKQQKVSDPLPSWKQTAIKDSILKFLDKDINKIPFDDRIAVFDMDGTLACEEPLWYEMYAAVNGLNQQSAKDSALLRQKEYQYAKKLAINPADTSVLNNWASTKGYYIDSMLWKAYAGVDHETYVDSARAYLTRTKNQKYGIPLAKMFYRPMLELIDLLKAKQFTIYVVSGSVQGVIWSVCPQTLGIGRGNLIGTRQALVPVYKPAENRTLFLIQKGIFPPTDNKDGKSENIYAHIGKVPVFAFGNTTGDFGMFHLTSTSKYPHAVFLLNHDDATREYAYPPYHNGADSTWQETMKQNHWNQVDMSTAFDTVWIK